MKWKFKKIISGDWKSIEDIDNIYNGCFSFPKPYVSHARVSVKSNFRINPSTINVNFLNMYAFRVKTCGGRTITLVVRDYKDAITFQYTAVQRYRNSMLHILNFNCIQSTLFMTAI